jgi:hypothetical protein
MRLLIDGCTNKINKEFFNDVAFLKLSTSHRNEISGKNTEPFTLFG